MNDGYRCELCGAWIEYRNLGKVLEHEGPLPHGAQDRPAVGDRTDQDAKAAAGLGTSATASIRNPQAHCGYVV
jgi:hypothetical protein